MPEQPLVPLSQLAHGRSGDKGNHANVAIIAYDRPGYEHLCAHLSAARVLAFFAGLGCARVERYLAPNVLGLNFVLIDALAGGASRSLRRDTQGKSYAGVLLTMLIEMR